MTIAQTIANLYNGVSQQPHALRSPSQADEQTNADATAARGLNKRPATRHIARVTPSNYGNCHVHMIDRSPSEKWMLVMSEFGVFVVNALTGATATVTFQDETGATITAPSYITAGDPKTAFRCLTVGEYTFVLNREVTVGLTPQSTGPFTYTDVQQFSDLPGTPVAGTIYRILGSGGDQFTSYYVKANGAGNAYIECRKEDLVNLLNRDTMPWALVKIIGGFAFRRVAYDQRLVGDEISCPPPLFSGRQIRDVFFYRNRLGFLTNSTVTLSRAGEYFNFYPRSMTQVADDDPIDEQTAHPKAPTLNSAATFNKVMLIFGDTVQFTLEGGDVLSPRSFALTPVTEFDCSQTARPVGLGPNIYFTQPVSGASRIREFYVSKDRVSSDAFDVTAHCPSYVPANVKHMAVSAAESLLAVLTQTEPDSLYIYRVMFDESGEKRTQSCWNKWNFQGALNGREILGFGISNATLYLLFSGSDGVYLEHLDLLAPTFPITDGEGNQWPILLDRIHGTGAGTYDAVNDHTTWTLPWAWAWYFPVSVVIRFGVNAGLVLETTRPNDNTVRAKGDWSTELIVVGIPYEMRYRLSQIFLRDNQGNPLVGGRLQLTGLRALFRKTGNFTLRVTPHRRAAIDRVWRSLTTSQSFIGYSTVKDGSVRMAVNSDAATVKLELINDTPLPCSFHALEWDGIYSAKVKKV